MALATLDLGHRNAAAIAPRAGVLARLVVLRLRVVDVVRLALALLIVAQLARIPVLSSASKDAPILLNDFLVGLVVAVGAITALRVRRLRIDAPAAWALSFALVGAISALLAMPRFGLTGFQLVFSLAYLARWLVYFGVYLVVINFVRRSDIPGVWATFEGAVLVFATFGIFQSIFLPGFAQIVYPESRVYVDWDYQGHRLVSTLLDPNFAGMLIAIPLLVLLARLAYGVPAAYWKLVLLSAALILTVSRSAFLALFAGLLVVVAVRGLTRRMLKAGAALLVLSLPFLPLIVSYAVSFNKLAIDGSALTRVVAWLRALVILADNPILGVGFNTYGFVQGYYGFKNVGNSAFGLDGGLLFIAVMTGVVGVLLYTGMLVSVLARCRRIWRAASAEVEERALALGVAAVTVALVVHSVFLNSLLYPFLMEPLWVLWGMTFLIPAGRVVRGVVAAGEPAGEGAKG